MLIPFVDMSFCFFARMYFQYLSIQQRSYNKAFFSVSVPSTISMFPQCYPLKYKVQDLSCVIYKGICSCVETYVGETICDDVYSGI